ncbi:hypothetical protein V8B55DRAFT_1499567, partial [Mucor lusitanicus]
MLFQHCQILGGHESFASRAKKKGIFFNTATRSDGLVCEDKPTDAESSKDCKKVKDLREKALLYWYSLLPFRECIDYLMAISCQFSKLKLTIRASKLIDEVMTHNTFIN